ncbi:MAG: hypothetical protein IJB70_04350 [Clostridia bacterium]|nr:hypothetical protein [Clostridia bacterium]
MTEIMSNTGSLCGAVMLVAFVVNIIVQMTKGFIPLPTKLWCILVSATIMLLMLFVASVNGYVKLGYATIGLSFIGSFVVAYVAMYGFDTLKDLWQRFKRGEDISNE